MEINWQDARKPNEAGRFSMMMDDAREGDEERWSRVSARSPPA